MINPDSSLDISAMEAVPLSHLDSQAINKALEEVKKRSSTPSKDETESAEVSIHMQVYTALSRAVSN